MLVFVYCSDWFDFCVFALTGLGAFVRAEVLCVSVWGVASGPGVGLAGCGGALDPPLRWFALPAVLGCGPGVGLALCCFVVCSTRRFVVSFRLSF